MSQIETSFAGRTSFITSACVEHHLPTWKLVCQESAYFVVKNSQMLLECFPAHTWLPTCYRCKRGVVHARADLRGRKVMTPLERVLKCLPHVCFFSCKEILGLVAMFGSWVTLQLLSNSEDRVQVSLSIIKTVCSPSAVISAPMTLYHNRSALKVLIPSLCCNLLLP